MRGSARRMHHGVRFTVTVALAMIAIVGTALVASADGSVGSGTAASSSSRTHPWDATHHRFLTWGTFSRPFLGKPVWAPDGTVFMTDCGNARIYRVTPTGKLTLYAGGGPGGGIADGDFHKVAGYGWIAAGT